MGVVWIVGIPLGLLSLAYLICYAFRDEEDTKGQ